jgi:hypothetical protein
MLAYPIRKSLLALALAAAAVPCATLLAPLSAHAQVREVVAKEVSVGRASAELGLEFADGGRLHVALEDGAVLLDGRSVGSYVQGDGLDVAWRGLLGQAVALDDGPLAEALAGWTVPAELTGEAADIARQLDQAIESAVLSVDADAEAVSGDAGSLLRALLRSRGRLGLLEEALAGLDSDVRVHVGENVEVPASEVVSGNLVVIEGEARIEGTVDGDVVVVGGSLELLEGSSVSGSVRLVDAELISNEGSVGDGVIDVEVQGRDLEAEVRAELRDEVRDEIRRELRVEMRDRDEGFSIFAPFRPVIRGVGGVLENLVAIFVLALIGAAVIAFGGDKVDVIAEAARRSPGRSAAVGMAATVLLIPIWILGFIALLVSIIGIPVAIAWLPLFPLAAFVAGIVGYLAVARNTGEWLAESDYPWTHWIRKSNPVVTTVGGLVGLMLLFIAANVVSMAPFLSVVTGLLVATGCIVTVLAIEVGLGAVIITRAGRRREQWSRYTADEAWEAAMKVDVEDVDIGDVNDVEVEVEVDVDADDSGNEGEFGKKKRKEEGNDA